MFFQFDLSVPGPIQFLLRISSVFSGFVLPSFCSPKQHFTLFPKKKDRNTNPRNYPGKGPQTVWGSGKIMYDNVDDGDGVIDRWMDGWMDGQMDR